jgi:hypothetical protein
MMHGDVSIYCLETRDAECVYLICRIPNTSRIALEPRQLSIHPPYDIHTKRVLFASLGGSILCMLGASLRVCTNSFIAERPVPFPTRLVSVEIACARAHDTESSKPQVDGRSVVDLAVD